MALGACAMWSARGDVGLDFGGGGPSRGFHLSMTEACAGFAPSNQVGIVAHFLLFTKYLISCSSCFQT